MNDGQLTFEQLVERGEVDFAPLLPRVTDAATAELCRQAFEAGRRSLSARLSALEHVAEALARIAEQQPKTLATLRHHGIVFDGPLGNDPKNWQHVAFSIYTDLCEVDTIARAALAELDAQEPA